MCRVWPSPGPLPSLVPVTPCDFRLSTCYNPNSLRTVPGNRSLYFSPGEGSVCILTELGSLGAEGSKSRVN